MDVPPVDLIRITDGTPMLQMKPRQRAAKPRQIIASRPSLRGLGIDNPKTSSAEGAADLTGGTTLRGDLVVASNRSTTRRIASGALSALTLIFPFT